MPPKSSAGRLWEAHGLGYLAGTLTRMVKDGQLTRKQIAEIVGPEGFKRLPWASDFGGYVRKFFQEGKAAGLERGRR